jgi:hypothetical protein
LESAFVGDIEEWRKRRGHDASYILGYARHKVREAGKSLLG